ncbi:hypothetical protein OsJ_16190 [Oryza sativa Japonica Group]|uniref:Uncharacterized protein n=1 Tax=Oryza sativa subsp. japonica TaxID=39947 RepID=B9FCJ9_ORYSJ|nr:hypothetical protein OsJ_16190 [Oryza sativa Japonica Group]
MGEPLRNGLIGPILLETFEYPSDSNVETYTRVYDDPEEEEGTTLDEAGNFNDNLENNIEELCRRLEGRYLQEKEQETLLLQ